MSATNFPLRRAARLVIELTSPCRIGSGRKGDGANNPLVVDHLGLPYLPGSAWAGALRAALRTHAILHHDIIDQLFGDLETGASRLTFTDGRLHDARNQPIEDWPKPDLLKNDLIVRTLHPSGAAGPLGTKRERVALNHRGISKADDSLKFNEQHAPAGLRFTVELVLVDTADQATSLAPAWQTLLGLLWHSADFDLTLGAGQQRGLGRFKIKSVLTGTFDLTKENELLPWAAHPVCLDKPAPALTPLPPPKKPSAKVAFSVITLTLKPESGWRFGAPKPKDQESEEKSTQSALKEKKIQWTTNTEGPVEASVADGWVIPGSSVRGPLWHRTLFHLLRLSQTRAPDADENTHDGGAAAMEAFEESPQVIQAKKAVRSLFGHADDQGQRSRLSVPEKWIPVTAGHARSVLRTPMDRLTMVTIATLNVETIHNVTEDFRLTITEADKVDQAVWPAFRAALKDLVEGRLELGSTSSIGLGYCLKSASSYDWPAALPQES